MSWNASDGRSSSASRAGWPRQLGPNSSTNGRFPWTIMWAGPRKNAAGLGRSRSPTTLIAEQYRAVINRRSRLASSAPAAGQVALRRLEGQQVGVNSVRDARAGAVAGVTLTAAGDQDRR